MKKVKAKTCYFTPEEEREIEEMSDKEERPASQIVQFAVRAFRTIYKEDRGRALQLAQVSSKD